MNNSNPSWPGQLREALNAVFTEDDLEALCFDMGIDYENLTGQNKSRKIIELIKYLRQTGRVVELMDYCVKQRPNVPWEEIRGAAIQDNALLNKENTSETITPKPRGRAISLEGKKNWHAKLLIKDGRNRRFQVDLTHSTHIIEYRFSYWKHRILLDGEIVSEHLWTPSFSFTIRDGSDHYRVEIGGGNNDAAFLLIIGGQVLYNYKK